MQFAADFAALVDQLDLFEGVLKGFLRAGKFDFEGLTANDAAHKQRIPPDYCV